MFGEATELDKQEWIRQAMMPNLKWLSKLDTIREKVHSAAKVPMLHINEQEAQKLLDRLQQEQEKIR